MIATATTLMNVAEPSALVRGTLRWADRPQRVRRQSRRAPATSLVCLVVSPDPLRQMMFSQAAARNGGNQVVCADHAAALPHLASDTVGLVLVDTVTPNPNTAADRRAAGRIDVRSRKNCSPSFAVAPTSPQEETWPASAALGCTCGRGRRKPIWIPSSPVQKSCPTYPSAKVAGHVQQP